MTKEEPKQILQEMEEQCATPTKGLERFQLSKNRTKVTQAFEAIIDEMGLRNLFDDHEVTRKKDGWVWKHTRKARRPAFYQKTWIE